MLRAVQKSFRIRHPELDTDFFTSHIETEQRHLEELGTLGDQLSTSFDDSIERGIRLGKDAILSILEEVYAETVPIVS